MAEVVTEPEQRSWLSHGLVGLAVASAGLALVAAGSLLEPTTAAGSQTTAPTVSTGTRTGTVDPAFDVTAQDVRSTPLPGAVANARAQGLQRSYLLAGAAATTLDLAQTLQQQQREQQLSSLHQTIDQTAAQIAQQQQDDQIARQVAAEMAARADAFRVEARAAALAATEAAAADASTATATGSWLPADTAALPPITTAVSPIAAATYGAAFGDVGPMWARYHTGLDFHAGLGEPIRAVADGVVTLAGRNGDSWAGLHVAVQHAGGWTTMDAHLSAIQVQVGQRVRAGDVIGLVGATGNVTGPHLHFEVYPPGVRPGDVYRAVNPLPWLEHYGVQLRRS